MSSLTEFLLARIAEDETLACSGQRWDYHWQDGALSGGSVRHGRVTVAEDWCGNMFSGHSRHIATWDPARVLAECAAKRAIIEFHEKWPILAQTEPQFQTNDSHFEGMSLRITQHVAWLTQSEYVKRFGTEPPTAPLLLALAAVYADHPDYRDEWRTT